MASILFFEVKFWGQIFNLEKVILVLRSKMHFLRTLNFKQNSVEITSKYSTSKKLWPFKILMLVSRQQILEAHISRGRRSWQLKIFWCLQFFVDVSKCAKYFLNLKGCSLGGGQARMIYPVSPPCQLLLVSFPEPAQWVCWMPSWCPRLRCPDPNFLWHSLFLPFLFLFLSLLLSSFVAN